MTNRQYKIFKAVRKYRKLPAILTATNCPDYMALQNEAGVGMLDFADTNMDDNTVITLTNRAAEAYEARRREDFDKTFTRCAAIYGAITGTVAIIVEVVLHFL